MDWEIPKNWEIRKLKNVSEINSGEYISKEDYRLQGTFDIIGSNGKIGEANKTNINKKVITTGRVGSIGTSHIVQDVWVTDNALIIETKKNILLEYLAYIIPMFPYEIISTGTAQPLITATILKNQYIPYSNLYDQQKIADFLNKKVEEIDSVIIKTKEIVEGYNKLKQAVITQAVTKGIRGDREMKNSGIEWIGEIPAEWNLIKVTRLLDYSHSYPIGDGDHGLIKTDDYIDAGVPYIRVQNLGWGTELDCDNIVYISEERNRVIANSILKPNDILFAKTGATIGKTAIVPSSIPVSNTTSHIGKITVSSDYIPRFVFYVMSSYLVYRQFWEIAGLKSTRPELSIDEIKKIKLIIPSGVEEQQEIVSYLDKKCSAIDDLIAKKEKYLTEIENYKKSLIYEYVTGKKEVSCESTD